jgi:hypothetical protein
MSAAQFSIWRSILDGIGVAFRVLLGILLLLATATYAAVFIDFGLMADGVINLFVAVAIGLFFVVLACVVSKILLSRRHGSRVRRFQVNFPPEEGFGPGLEGALVPKPTRPRLPTLSAAAQIPREAI